MKKPVLKDMKATGWRAAMPLFFLAALINSHPVRAGGEPSSKRVFEKLYSDIHVAMVRKDRDAYSIFLTPDFASEDVSGKVESKEQMFAELDQIPSDPNRKAETTVLSVKVTTTSAKVTQRYHMNTTRPRYSGQTEQVELTAFSIDTWKRMRGVWRMSHTVTREIELVVNGRTVMHKTHI